MKCWIREELDPGVNLAFEEAVLRKGVDGGAFWLWRDAPSVIVGRNQTPEVEVSRSVARVRGIRVYRRKTGGGAVFHDEGVVNFSFVVPFANSVRELMETVRSALGVRGSVSERNDILCRGFKIVGTAQRLQGQWRLFHGSILYDANLGVLASVLTPDASKLARHGVASVAARVANLKDLMRREVSTEDFMRDLFRRIVAARGWTVSDPVRPCAALVPLRPCALGETDDV